MNRGSLAFSFIKKSADEIYFSYALVSGEDDTITVASKFISFGRIDNEYIILQGSVGSDKPDSEEYFGSYMEAVLKFTNLYNEIIQSKIVDWWAT